MYSIELVKSILPKTAIHNFVNSALYFKMYKTLSNSIFEIKFTIIQILLFLVTGAKTSFVLWVVTVFELSFCSIKFNWNMIYLPYLNIWLKGWLEGFTHHQPIYSCNWQYLFLVNLYIFTYKLIRNAFVLKHLGK